MPAAPTSRYLGGSSLIAAWFVRGLPSVCKIQAEVLISAERHYRKCRKRQCKECRDIEEWLGEEDFVSPCSFENCCGAVGLSTDVARLLIRRRKEQWHAAHR